MGITKNDEVHTWYAIFGDDVKGSSPEECAANSQTMFVRSQDELGLWNETSRGLRYTAKEALYYFGAERIRRVYYDGSAILTRQPAEPAKTLRERREALGLTQSDIARYTALPFDTVAHSESSEYTSSIHDLMRIAIVLSLDDTRLGFEPGANGDKAVAVRLKAWRQDRGSTPASVALLSEAAWVISTQDRLQNLLTPAISPMAGFHPDPDYGTPSYPAWEAARTLADETRNLLGVSPTEPIMSLRTLCHTLRVPLIHAELPPNIAGATLATGNTRGIVVNVKGNGTNVWVQRATIAHELGHLLWDPAEKLRALVVDEQEQIEVIDRGRLDTVEARANAFAVELLAPKNAIRDFIGQLDPSDYALISSAIRKCMVHFGLSATATRYHVWNTYERQFDIEQLLRIDPAPTDEWKGREAYTDDYFVLPRTPILRRGHFAGIVARADLNGWLSDQGAAMYLSADLEVYKQQREQLISLYDA